MYRIYIVIVLLISSLKLFGQYSIKTIPNNKLINNSYVSDPDNFINAATVAAIDSICTLVEDSTSAQIALVVLNSIGGENPHDFGTRLFNYWGVGTAESKNGLMILMVMSARRVEFITGDGTESILPDIRCYRIQQDYMVPYFKQNNYDTGLKEGVAAAASYLLKNDVYAPRQNNNQQSQNYTYNQPKKNYTYHYRPKKSGFELFLMYYLFYVIAPFLSLYMLLFFGTLFTKDYFRKYQLIKLFELNIFRILAPIPFLFLHELTKNIIEYWRNAPRFSAKTGVLMSLLCEKEDNNYLKAGQIQEEHLKSVDYDVWVGEDKEDVLILPYIKWFSGFSKCPKCRYRAYQLDYNRTIVAATYSSSGTGEKKHSCKSCHYSKVQRYTIAQLQESSTTSSSSSYSSSSYSSSSSSGGSWGGGSSSGGGAGSSW